MGLRIVQSSDRGEELHRPALWGARWGLYEAACHALHTSAFVLTCCSHAALLEWEALRDASHHTEESLDAMDKAAKR